jgi:hypothetical protein
MEKIINEFRVIETDDGFRIEIKGDKEKIKSFIAGFGRHGPRPHRHGQHGRATWGPFGVWFDPWMWMKAASCWGMWDSEAEADEEPEEAKKV